MGFFSATVNLFKSIDPRKQALITCSILQPVVPLLSYTSCEELVPSALATCCLFLSPAVGAWVLSRAEWGNSCVTLRQRKACACCVPPAPQLQRYPHSKALCYEESARCCVPRPHAASLLCLAVPHRVSPGTCFMLHHRCPVAHLQH